MTFSSKLKQIFAFIFTLMVGDDSMTMTLTPALNLILCDIKCCRSLGLRTTLKTGG